jgi:hypothetical protein
MHVYICKSVVVHDVVRILPLFLTDHKDIRHNDHHTALTVNINNTNAQV